MTLFGTLTSIKSLNENGVLAEAETALSRFLYAAERLNNLYRDMAEGAEVEADIDVNSPMLEGNIGSGIWEKIGELKNNDGSYSLYDNQRNKRKKIFHEQLFVFELSKPSLSFEEGLSVGLGFVSGTVITGGFSFGGASGVGASISVKWEEE